MEWCRLMCKCFILEQSFFDLDVCVPYPLISFPFDTVRHCTKVKVLMFSCQLIRPLGPFSNQQGGSPIIWVCYFDGFMFYVYQLYLVLVSFGQCGEKCKMISKVEYGSTDDDERA